MTTDKRKYVRFDTGIDANVQPEGCTAMIPAPIRDVSKGGLGFSSQRDLTQGSGVRLEITLPGELVPIFAEGQVVWCEPANEVWRKEHDCGIKISNIDPFDRSRLLDFAYEKWLHINRA